MKERITLNLRKGLRRDWDDCIDFKAFLDDEDISFLTDEEIIPKCDIKIELTITRSRSRGNGR